jgi:hypothetical protein
VIAHGSFGIEEGKIINSALSLFDVVGGKVAGPGSPCKSSARENVQAYVNLFVFSGKPLTK